MFRLASHRRVRKAGHAVVCAESQWRGSRRPRSPPTVSQRISQPPLLVALQGAFRHMTAALETKLTNAILQERYGGEIRNGWVYGLKVLGQTADGYAVDGKVYLQKTTGPYEARHLAAFVNMTLSPVCLASFAGEGVGWHAGRPTVSSTAKIKSGE